MRVHLTGGTGLVGSHVAEQARAAGHDVVALVRPTSDATFLRDLGCELVVGDVADGAPLDGAMVGCDAVVHAAALVGRRASHRTYRKANVEGTRRVFDAAARTGVRRGVHVSSVAVYGPIDGPAREDRWLEVDPAPRAAYARSKRDAEIEAWRHDAAGGLRVTTVRPALIYGERDRHVARRMDRLVRVPVLPLADAGRWTPPLVYAGNVARGILAALETERAAGRAYNLAADHALSLRAFLDTWCEVRGIRRPRYVSVPGPALRGAAATWDLLSRALPGFDLPGLARPARLVTRDNPYVSERAERELGWTERVSPVEAMRRTSDWLNGSTDRRP